MVKQSHIRAFIKLVSVLLIILWIYAAGSKLTDIADFKRGLNNQPFSKDIVKILFFALPIFEISTAILLVFPKTKNLGLQLSAFLLASFSIYIILILLNFWSRVPCSCGGILESMGWKTHLIFNVIFLFFTIYAIYLKRKEAPGKV